MDFPTMQWIEPSRPRKPSAAILATLAQQASAHTPASPWSILAEANAAFSIRDFARAADLFEAAARGGIAADMDWSRLARSYLETGRTADALRACDRGFAIQAAPGYDLSMQAGFAHLVLRDHDEARRHFLRAAELGNTNEACWHILYGPAQANDAPEILTLCDELEARFGPSSVFTANRALAWSMIRDERRAARLVDLDRHVRVGQISEFLDGDIAELNTALAREAIAIADGNGSPEKSIVPSPDLSGSPAIRSLQMAVRAAIETYLAEADERGLEHCLPLPLKKATLSTGTTLLRRDGQNGQHIHLTSVISAVYHLENPATNAASTGAGALQIGPADQYAGGHVACWGEKRVLPQPGQLTIFPAHFFHDVIPTGSDRLRISFPSDVHAVW